MSTIQVNLMADSQGGSVAPISSVMRNRIINGAMTISQRNAGASVSISGLVASYTLDRWVIRNDTEGVVSVQQSSVAPTGFNNSLLYTVTTPDTSLGASQNYSVQQRIEGFNMADFGWGTANAATVTLSFFVRSSLTGTFGGAISNSAANRSFPFTYTINAANTWEQKTVTIAGDTTGTWLTTNGVGAYIYLSTGAGSTVSGTAGAWAASDFRSATGATSVVGTNGATFYITGVQLEKGTQATSFEYRQYGQELALCQRYFEIIREPFGAGRVNGTPACRFFARFTVVKRATPSIGSSGAFSVSDMFSLDTQQSSATGLSTVSGVTTNGTIFGINSSSLNNSGPFTIGAMCFNLDNGASITASAEL